MICNIQIAHISTAFEDLPATEQRITTHARISERKTQLWHYRSRPPKPPKTDDWPRTINITLSFEAALQLQLNLQHALLDINKLNRSTKEGKRGAVDLCLWTGERTITSTSVDGCPSGK